jgi:hypothetical protein
MTFGTNDHTVEFWYYLPGGSLAGGYATQWKYSSGSTQQGTNDYYFQADQAGGGTGLLREGCNRTGLRYGEVNTMYHHGNEHGKYHHTPMPPA